MSSVRKLVTEMHRRSLWQVLAIYLAGCWVVIEVVGELTDQLGLPDWVPPFAIVLLALELPVVLATAFVQERDSEPSEPGAPDAEPPVTTPKPDPSGTSAAAASVPAGPRRRRLTWRTATMLGVGGFALLGLASAAYMGLGAAGVGPAATLVSRGLIEEREPLLLAAFENNTPDSLLSETFAEAIRIDLLQSATITLVDPTRVAETLELMGRDPASMLDQTLAREVAAREGVSAVIGGDIRSVGDGFVLSAELLSVETGESLVAVREDADDVSGLIPAFGRISQALRERIGESLRSIRRSEPLEQVSTSSLEALRRYTAGLRLADREGDDLRANELFEQAIALDSTFAMAHRRLGSASRIGRDRAVRALRDAYRYRDRLVERERLLVTASYHGQRIGGRDSAIAAYRRVLAADPNEPIALNNLALLLRRSGNIEGSLDLLRRAQEVAPSDAAYLNLALDLTDLDRFDEAMAALEEGVARFPDNWLLRVWFVGGLTSRRDYDAADSLATAQMAEYGDNFSARIGLTRFLAWIDGVRGRLASSEARLGELVDLTSSVGVWQIAYGDVIRFAELSIWSRRDTSLALRQVDALLERFPLADREPLDRPYLALARLYARAGDAARARAMLVELEREVAPELRAGAESQLDLVRGIVALSEGRLTDAEEAFREADADKDAQCLLCPQHELARVFESRSEADSAIALYEDYVGTSWAMRVFEDPMRLPYTLERLGQLLDARGETERAARYYAEFVELWEGADPELQDRVAAARQRLEELR